MGAPPEVDVEDTSPVITPSNELDIPPVSGMAPLLARMAVTIEVVAAMVAWVVGGEVGAASVEVGVEEEEEEEDDPLLAKITRVFVASDTCPAVSVEVPAPILTAPAIDNRRVLVTDAASAVELAVRVELPVEVEEEEEEEGDKEEVNPDKAVAAALMSLRDRGVLEGVEVYPSTNADTAATPALGSPESDKGESELTTAHATPV